MTNSLRPNQRHDDSPLRLARIAGVLYAIVTVTALFAEIGVRSRLITFGDPNRTVTNIIIRDSLYRLGAGAIAGLCYLINGYSALVAPEFKRAIYPYVLIPAGLGEWSLMIWLLMARVDRERWYAMNSG